MSKLLKILGVVGVLAFSSASAQDAKQDSIVQDTIPQDSVIYHNVDFNQDKKIDGTAKFVGNYETGEASSIGFSTQKTSFFYDEKADTGIVQKHFYDTLGNLIKTQNYQANLKARTLDLNCEKMWGYFEEGDVASEMIKRYRTTNVDRDQIKNLISVVIKSSEKDSLRRINKVETIEQTPDNYSKLNISKKSVNYFFFEEGKIEPIRRFGDLDGDGKVGEKDTMDIQVPGQGWVPADITKYIEAKK